MMNHIVFFSSGAASWAAAKRVADKHGQESLYLVFADTGIEDEDNYRFLHDAAKNVGGRLIVLRDGRSPWDIFKETRWLSHRGPKCSKILKIQQCENWIKECEFDPKNTILYFGIGWEEYERMRAISHNWSPFKVEAPLCWDDMDWLDRKDIFKWAKRERLRLPRLYSMGFSHANCGGFCVRAGQAHFANLLKHFPERYREHEKQEEQWQKEIGSSVTILVRVKNGKKKSLSLKQFREEIESQPLQLELFEGWGGCGCFVGDSLSI